VFHLAPQLTCKAQLAYAAVPPADMGEYNAVKTAILARYNINTEVYCQRFCSTTRSREESFREPNGFTGFKNVLQWHK